MGTRIEQKEDENELTAYLDYVVSLLSFIKTDLDIEYYKTMSKGIEYGMSAKEFWECNIQEFYCYETAYINRQYDSAYINGFYNYQALGVVVGNLFVKKGDKALEYPRHNIYNPFNKNAQNKRFSGNNEGLRETKALKSSQNDLFHIKRQMKGGTNG